MDQWDDLFANLRKNPIYCKKNGALTGFEGTNLFMYTELLQYKTIVQEPHLFCCNWVQLH